MTAKPLILLAAVTLCIALHVSSGQACRCIRTISSPVAVRVIKKIEVIPISGHCRWIEIIVTRRNGSKVCVNAKERWVNNLISSLQEKNATSASTTASPTGSKMNF